MVHLEELTSMFIHAHILLLEICVLDPQIPFGRMFKIGCVHRYTTLFMTILAM